MTMREEILREAWRIMAEATPLSRDCGLYCGAACCAPDGDGQGGVYLFPGEGALMAGAEWGGIVRDDFAEMLLCREPCDRRRRPLNCRFFPLLPYRGKDGGWRARMDARARAVCPLTRAGLRGLDPGFAKAVTEAAAALARDAECLEFMKRWSAQERAFRRGIGEMLG